MTEPHWKGRGIAAAAVARKSAEAVKPPRNYVSEAVAVMPPTPAPVGDRHPALVAAVIVAQALDRLGEKMTEAALVSNYKRAS